jgi:hypothetical protein
MLNRPEKINTKEQFFNKIGLSYYLCAVFSLRLYNVPLTQQSIKDNIPTKINHFIHFLQKTQEVNVCCLLIRIIFVNFACLLLTMGLVN